MSQDLIAAALVGLAALYAVWRFMPAALRHGLAKGVAKTAVQTGVVSTATAKRIEIKVATPAGGCGDCGPCKGCDKGRTAAPGTAADSPL